MDILGLATKVRKQFESGEIEISRLAELYSEYNPTNGVENFVKKAINIFPSLNCGLACVYLKDILKEGEIINGKYGEHNHTFLMVDEQVIDITADQYGGPKVYVGPLKSPWKK